MKKELLTTALISLLFASSFKLVAQHELPKNYLAFGYERQVYTSLPKHGAILYGKEIEFNDYFSLSFNHVFNQRFRLEFSGNFSIVYARYTDYAVNYKYSRSQVSFQPMVTPHFTFVKTKYLDFSIYSGLGVNFNSGKLNDVINNEKFEYHDTKFAHQYGLSIMEKFTPLNTTINLGISGIGKANFVTTGVKVNIDDLKWKKKQ